MNQTPYPGNGAADRDAFNYQTERITADAAARAAAAQRDATDNRIAAQNKLFAVLGINGQNGLLQSVDQRGPEVDWIRGEINAGRDVQHQLIGNMGNAQRNQIERTYDNAVGTGLARLDARGLGASSMAGNVLASAAESRTQSDLNLNEQLLNARLETERTTRTAMTGAMENQLLRDQENKALNQQYASLIGSVWS